MSIIIQEIIHAYTHYSEVKLTHHNTSITGKVFQTEAWLNEAIQTQNPQIIEFLYYNLMNYVLLNNFDDSQSFLLQENDVYTISGRITNILDIENDQIIDVYIQNGAEFITILRSELNEDVVINQGIRFTVEDLHFYPINI